MKVAAPSRPQGQIGGLTTSQSPPFTVPMRYMLLGLSGFIVFAATMVIQSFSLGRGIPLRPSTVSLTHVLTLMSLLSFVMGAVYQLSTVAFLIPLASVSLARQNFWLYATGVIGLVISMGTWWISGLVLFGSLVTLSLYLYVGVVLVSVSKTRVKGPVVWFVQAAHSFLAVAVTVAILMILSFGGVGVFSTVFQQLLWTHIILATGFFTFLILGFSYKLLPMFTLSHGFSTRRQPWTFGLAMISVLLLVTGVWLHVSLLLVIGAVVAIAAFVNQVFDVRGIYQKRLRKRTEVPMKAAMSAVGIAALAMAGFVVLVLRTQGLAGWQGFVTLYLLGWITLTVMSYSYKIVPFLVWTNRYSVHVENGQTPLIKDMIDVDRARPVLVLFVIGLLVLALTCALQQVALAGIGAVACAAAVGWFFLQMVTVMKPGTLRQELMRHD